MLSAQTAVALSVVGVVLCWEPQAACLPARAPAGSAPPGTRGESLLWVSSRRRRDSRPSPLPRAQDADSDSPDGLRGPLAGLRATFTFTEGAKAVTCVLVKSRFQGERLTGWSGIVLDYVGGWFCLKIFEMWQSDCSPSARKSGFHLSLLVTPAGALHRAVHLKWLHRQHRASTVQV